MQEPDSVHPPDGQQLCMACGLCCTGVWFSHVNLEPDEFEPAHRAGMQVAVVDGKTRSHQPCALHQKGQCSGYQSWRPAACVMFRCQLLDNFVDAKLTLDQALAHVVAARAMAERIRGELGNVQGGLLGSKFLSRIDDDTAPIAAGEPATSPATKLDAVALNMYYVKFFKKPDKTEESK